LKNVTHYINGQQIDGIRNWEQFEIVIDFELQEGGSQSQQVEFAGDANEYIRKVISDGSIGGTGIFEGIPYDIRIEQDGSVYNYNAYIDLSQKMAFIGNDTVVATVNRRQGENWLNDVADGFGLQSMQSTGEIKTEDYTEIKYVINYKPDYLQVATLTVSITILAIELEKMIAKIFEKRSEEITDSIPLFSVLNVVINIPRIVWHIIMIVINTVLAIAVLFAMVNMIITLLDEILPKSKTYLGMTVKRMFEVCCSHLDLELKSNLLTGLSKLMVLPAKSEFKGEDANPIRDLIKGKDDIGIAISDNTMDSFGDIIRVFKSTFNADFRIRDGVFEFERRDFFNKAGDFIMPDIFSDQENLKDNYSYNTDEFISNYNISFRFDSLDENTLENSNGIAYQSSLQPIKVGDKKLVTMKGLSRVDIPFAIGVKKNKLTAVEQLGFALGSGIDAVASLFGASSNLSSDVKDNTGVLLLSGKSFSVPKLFFHNNKKVFDFVSAKWLWDNFHYINSFSLSYDDPNQWKLHDETRIPISVENVNDLVKNNSGSMPNGNPMIVTKMVWIPHEDVSLAKYREREVYTKNLKETLL